MTAFKEAGFRTIWISLQAPVGFHDSPISVHAYEAEHTIFLNPVDYRQKGKLDTAAIPALKRLIAQSNDDLFVVIHTLGSHFRYIDRYPLAAAKFLPDRPQSHSPNLYRAADRETLSNAYDNTIVQMDITLDGLIDTLERQVDVMSWLFYASANPTKIAGITTNRSRPLSTEMGFHTLADLGGLQVPGGTRGQSIAGVPATVPTFVLAVEQERSLACPTKR